ncbi:DUF11 domain-containing protein, partial [Bacteriovoracaceae bacterium]|nr:DUF11 domain-containing protein [Bacteriovoracaceae bacterium]
ESTTTAAINTLVEDIISPQVTVTNVLPIDGIYSTGSTSNHILWTIPQILPGESALLQIKITPESPVGPSCFYDLPNTAEIISTDLPNVSQNTSSSVLSQVEGQDGVSLEFVFDPNTDINHAERIVDFTVKAHGNNQTTYSNVEIQLTIPSNFMAAPVSQLLTTGSYNSSNNIWSLGVLNAGAIEELTLSLKLEPSSTLTSFTIGAMANTLTTPINCINSNPKINGEFNPSNVNLVIEKTSSIVVGGYDDQVVYTITVTNEGTTLASDIIVNEVFDITSLNIDESQVTWTAGSYAGGVWEGFNLLPNETATLIIPAQLTTYACEGEVENTVMITQVFPANSNNTNSANALIELNNDQNVKVAIVDVVENQADFTAIVKLEVTNDSSVQLTGVEIKNTINSAGIEFVNPADETMIIAAMDPGEVKLLEYQVKQNLVIPNFNHQVQVDFIKANQPECNSEGDSSFFEFDFDPPPMIDIQVEKVANQSEVSFGDEIIYTIEVKNLGNIDASGILIQDLLSPYITLTDVSDITVSSGNFTVLPVAGQEQVNWTIPSIAPFDGTSFTIEKMFIKVTVNSAECEIPIYNQAQFIDLNDVDLNNLNDQDAVIINNVNNNDLIITSTHEVPYVENNQQKVKVVLAVTNNSAITFNNVLVQNTINQNSFVFENITDELITFPEVLPGDTALMEMILVRVSNPSTNHLSLDSIIIGSDQEQCNGDEDL